MKMIKKFVEYLRGIFSENVEITRMLVTDERPEIACDMQDKKVYAEEFPSTPEEEFAPTCTCGQDHCVCYDVEKTVEEVAAEETTAVVKKKHRGRPRKRNAKKD